MALTNTQYDTIIRVYNKKQLQNRRDQESRIALAEKELPELSKINEEIASLSMKCARRLLNDEPASLDELKTEINAYGQHRKILLKNAGFPEDFNHVHRGRLKSRPCIFRSGRKFQVPGRKKVTKETREGCLSF